MYKKLFSALAVTVAMLSCSQPNGYKVSGTAEGTEDGDTVFICQMQGFFNMIPQDTAIVKNGKFCFEGEAEGAQLRFLVPMHDGEPTTMAMFILENADIKAQLGKGEDANNDIKAGPNGQLFAKFGEGNKALDEEINAAWDLTNDSTLTEEEKAAAEARLDSLRAVQTEQTRHFIIDNVPSAISDMLFGFYGDSFTDEQKEEILQLFAEKQPEYPFYRAIMAERAASAATAVGQPYIDLEMPTPEGEPTSISAHIGQNSYLLVDFWASWCGPCRAEMPTVVQAYDTYHSKGFEVLGVSFDNDKDAWVAAIEQLKMPWPQMSDLKGWESAAAEAYNVRAIPANVLIDKDGKIVAKDLRGEDLLNKLAELLK